VQTGVPVQTGVRGKAGMMAITTCTEGATDTRATQRFGCHKVLEIVQKGTNFVIFRDDFGLTWRYLRDWRRAWPVWVNVKW